MRHNGIRERWFFVFVGTVALALAGACVSMLA